MRARLKLCRPAFDQVWVATAHMELLECGHRHLSNVIDTIAQELLAEAPMLEQTAPLIPLPQFSKLVKDCMYLVNFLMTSSKFLLVLPRHVPAMGPPSCNKSPGTDNA